MSLFWWIDTYECINAHKQRASHPPIAIVLHLHFNLFVYVPRCYSLLSSPFTLLLFPSICSGPPSLLICLLMRGIELWYQRGESLTPCRASVQSDEGRGERSYQIHQKGQDGGRKVKEWKSWKEYCPTLTLMHSSVHMGVCETSWVNIFRPRSDVFTHHWALFSYSRCFFSHTFCDHTLQPQIPVVSQRSRPYWLVNAVQVNAGHHRLEALSSITPVQFKSVTFITPLYWMCVSGVYESSRLGLCAAPSFNELGLQR